MTRTEGIEENIAHLELAGLPNNITALRELPAHDFIDVVYVISVDELILTELPSVTYSELDKRGNVFNVEKLIMGYNSMDGIIGWPWHAGRHPKSNSQYKDFLSAYISNQTQVDLLYNDYYPPSDFPSLDQYENASIAWFTLTGDVCVKCPTLIQLEEILRQNGEKRNISIWSYFFRGGGEPYYAPHAS